MPSPVPAVLRAIAKGDCGWTPPNFSDPEDQFESPRYPCPAVFSGAVISYGMAGKRAWRRLSLWAPPVAYMAVIFYLSSESQPLPQLTELLWDKLLHTVEYTGLAVLLFRALSGEGLGKWTAAAATIVLVSAYGASDEWHQMFVPMRSSDIFDWLTDTLAGAIGAALSVAFAPRRSR